LSFAPCFNNNRSRAALASLHIHSIQVVRETCTLTASYCLKYS
jgi:hypothetical protein